MCLYVTSRKKKLVLKVFKYLYDDQFGLMTPFRMAQVPDDGLLVPAPGTTNQIKKDESVHGGYIHSFVNKSKDENDKDIGWEMFTAYAICVEAYGNNNDVVSLALYIPNADKTKKKNDNRKVAALNKARSRKDIVKIFPKLKELLCDKVYY